MLAANPAELLQSHQQASDVTERTCGALHTTPPHCYNLIAQPVGSGGASIARQPLGKRETVMRPLRTREDGRRWCWRRRQGLLKRHVHPLAAHELHAGAPMLSATPITPEQRSGAKRERMQQQTDPTRLCRLWAVPLTLLAQGARATVAYPGGVEHPQAAIGFATLFGWVQRLVRRTAQGPVRLERKGFSREAARLPGRGARSACHSPPKAHAPPGPRRWREQTRWCAARSAQADDPAPGAGSKPIG